jgi:adenylosuccinate lyase
MQIFNGDTEKIDRLNKYLCQKAGFHSCYEISSQTYSRKVDLRIANALSSFGATAVRIATVSPSFQDYPPAVRIFMLIDGWQ